MVLHLISNLDRWPEVKAVLGPNDRILIIKETVSSVTLANLLKNRPDIHILHDVTIDPPLPNNIKFHTLSLSEWVSWCTNCTPVITWA